MVNIWLIQSNAKSDDDPLRHVQQLLQSTNLRCGGPFKIANVWNRRPGNCRLFFFSWPPSIALGLVFNSNGSEEPEVNVRVNMMMMMMMLQPTNSGDESPKKQ